MPSLSYDAFVLPTELMRLRVMLYTGWNCALPLLLIFPKGSNENVCDHDTWVQFALISSVEIYGKNPHRCENRKAAPPADTVI